MRGVRGIAISLIFTHDHIVGSSVELIEVVFFKVHRRPGYGILLDRGL